MKLKHLSIFLLIILFTTLLVKSNLTHTEEVFTGSGALEVKDILTYEDNTIVLRIIYTLPPHGDCNNPNFETNLSFRVIYPNGTIKPIDLSGDELGIQPLNFCTVIPQQVPIDPITFYAIETTKDKFILVTYTVAADIKNTSTYNDYVMLIDLYGNVYSNASLGPSLIIPINNQWIPHQNFILPNVNNDRGFLYWSKTSNNDHKQTQWIINDDLSLSNITAEMILPPIPNQTQFLATATVDGGYMIILTNSTNPNDPNSPPGGGDLCHILINYSGVGHACLLTLQPNSTTNSNPTPYFIKVNFLSQGTVFDATLTPNTIPNPDNTQHTNPKFGIMSLRFGGYFYRVTEQNNNAKLIWGYVLDDNETFHNWDLQYPTELNYYTLRQVLTNNTAVMVQPTVNQTWGLITTDLYKVYGGDNPYGNILITNTTPTIGKSIPANEIHNITITYAIPVALSDGTITIFQSNDNLGIVRQNVSGSDENYVTLDNNNTVNVKVINGTFNNPGKTYYVMIANNFVKSQLYHEPLYGLNNYVWSFTIMEEEKASEQSKFQKWLLGSIDGKVRLLPEGKVYFDNLTRINKQREFFNNLTKELFDALSIASVQITTTERFQIDTTLPDNSLKQYLLSININNAEGRAYLIADYLDNMIRNNSITALATGYSSKYLDPNYGYETIPKWYKNPSLMFQLILTGIFILILTILCLISISYDAKNEVKSKSDVKNDEKNDKKSVIKTFFSIIIRDIHDLIQFLLPSRDETLVERNHFKIYSYGFSILTFVLDILFAKIEASSVENIFFASVFFVTVPYAIKSGYAVHIILGELVRKKESEEDSEKLRLIPTKDLEGQRENSEGQREDSEGQREDSEGQREDSEGQRESSEGQRNEEKVLKKVMIMEWLKSSRSHKIILVIVITLAGADVEALNILGFQFYGYEFGIKFSDEFEERIILGKIISIIIKSIPELAIRSYFLNKLINFNYLSTLSLLTTVIKILSFFTKPKELKELRKKKGKKKESLKNIDDS
ncbi:unnamed protein product [Rhizophagus irregularis]|uniref:SbsA Ig-like domain-containing protein n=1 Tax=Rhizophagus irregularis TaxID=588596 RepID=A0A2I1H209_9GLOM|nr:hypothetical protein RhiirA4_470845 [Rhizophagus irregularis]CAB4441709.1 unnamed protein product [Rhizophagus irregularis]